MGALDMQDVAEFDGLGVGGLVVNPWNCDPDFWLAAASRDWTVWLNDYYMYPSGNANPLGGVHDTLWNPGFETHEHSLWPDGWTWSYYGWPCYDVSGAEAHSGLAAVCADDLNCLAWPVAVESGAWYAFSAWSRGMNGDEIGRLVVGWYEVDALVDIAFLPFQCTHRYQRFELQAQAPVGANVARLFVQGHETDRYVWFDDVLIQRVDTHNENLLTNPGFEADVNGDGVPDDWMTDSQPGWHPGQGRNGSAAARVNGGHNLFQIIPIKPGVRYQLTQWIKADGDHAMAQLLILWTDDAFEILDASQSSFQVVNTYQRHDCVIQAPQAEYAAIVMGGASSEWVWVDDVTFCRATNLSPGLSRGPVLDGHPELEAQGLFHVFEDVGANQAVNLTLPDGKRIRAVAAPRDESGVLDLDRQIDLSPYVQDNTLYWHSGAGDWRVMAFVCAPLYEGTQVGPALSNMHQINVLNEVAVSRFVDEMYNKTLYETTRSHWGDLIRASFSDEVSNLAGFFLHNQPHPVIAWLHDEVNGLFLTDAYFRIHGEDLLEKLPALFHDVGELTPKIRVDFYSLVADLQGEVFFKTIDDWCQTRGIALSGHLLSEEHGIHQTAFYGDIFACLKHMGIPGMDTLIYDVDRLDASLIVPKLVSSAALIYGKPHTMTEYSVASSSLELAKMNAIINWQAVQGIDIVTSFSFNREHLSESALSEHAAHVGRVNRMLDFGRYSADVAVLYPTTTFQAEYVPRSDMIWDTNLFGGFGHDQALKQLVQSLLSSQTDFFFVTDEVLQNSEICREHDTTFLTIGPKRVRAKCLVLPSMDVMKSTSWDTAEAFFEAGGTLVHLGDIPHASAERGVDPELRDEMVALFGAPLFQTGDFYEITNPMGGLAIGAGEYHEGVISRLNREIAPRIQVEGEPVPQVYVTQRQHPFFDLFFIVNNAGQSIKRDIRLRSLGEVEVWNPHDVTVESFSRIEDEGAHQILQDITIPGYQAIFILVKKTRSLGRALP